MIRDQMPKAPTKRITPTDFPGPVTVRGLMMSEVLAQQEGRLEVVPMIAALVTDEDGAPLGTVSQWEHWALVYPKVIPEVIAAAKSLTPGIDEAKKE